MQKDRSEKMGTMFNVRILSDGSLLSPSFEAFIPPHSFPHYCPRMAAKALGVALVTGASQGIGRAIALRLGKDGFKVAVNDIADKSHQLKAVSQEIEQLNGHKTHFVTADVSNEAEVEAMVDTVTKNLGGLDVVSLSVQRYSSIEP